MNTTSSRAPAATAPSQVGSSPRKVCISGRAATAPTTDTGRSSSTVQVSSALAVRPAVAPVLRVDRAGEQRHDEGRERAAGDHLEDHVGQAVGRLVDVADAAGAEGAGQHGDPPEADRPGQHRDAGDADGRAEQPAP